MAHDPCATGKHALAANLRSSGAARPLTDAPAAILGRMSQPSVQNAIVPGLPQELPCITGDLPGVGGILKQEAADFVVEEIPAYPPAGAGEFLYLWVEKTGLSAEQLTSHVARALQIAHQDIGMAGLKDRHAVTRQFLSVPVRCESRLKDLTHPAIRVLESHRHRNKLRPGHLRGNRFSILLRETHPDALPRAQAIAERISRLGFPNYFGDQRFGRDSETLDLGFELLRGTKMPGDIPRARRKFLLRLALSAVQSSLFNQALAGRLQEETLHCVRPGDVMQVVASHGVFVAEDLAREQARYDAGEIAIAGPLFGPKMLAAAGETAACEAALLAGVRLDATAFTKFSNLTSGTRRAYCVRPEALELAVDQSGLRLAFTLPAGCYATVLLREFQKS